MPQNISNSKKIFLFDSDFFLVDVANTAWQAMVVIPVRRTCLIHAVGIRLGCRRERLTLSRFSKRGFHKCETEVPPVEKIPAWSHHKSEIRFCCKAKKYTWIVKVGARPPGRSRGRGKPVGLARQETTLAEPGPVRARTPYHPRRLLCSALPLNLLNSNQPETFDEAPPPPTASHSSNL